MKSSHSSEYRRQPLPYRKVITTDPPSPHSFLAAQPNEVLIAIWSRGHDWMDSSIKLLTRGYGTHAAFVRGNGNVIENFYPRVRERGWNAGERATVEEYRIAGTGPGDWAKMEEWFDDQLKNPPAYSILDLVRYAFDLPPLPGAACFCSGWVLRGCRMVLPAHLQPLVRLQYPDWAAPRDLRISPGLHLRKKRPLIAK